MSGKKIARAACLAAVLFTVGCRTAKSPDTAGAEASKDIFAMDTYMTLTAYGAKAEEAVEKAEAEILRLDALLSTGDPNSEVARLNQERDMQVSTDTAYLLERSLELYEETDGAFDIAIYPVMAAWGFPSQEYRVPSEEELLELLAYTDASKAVFDAAGRHVSLGEGMQIDLGGIAKGYASARVMDIYRECGVESGIVNLGGNVQTMGSKPDGSLWRVAVQSPEEAEDYVGVLSVADRAVITSGGYERYFEQDGKTYHHIIDPDTGYPADSGLVSVTVVSADGTLADALSTSLFVMGLDRAEVFWRERSDTFDAVLMTEEGELYVTENIADSFTSGQEIHVLEK